MCFVGPLRRSGLLRTEMEAIVLAGGFGTRLGELTRNCPKPLLPVNGRPFLEYVLHGCLRFPIEAFVLAIGYLGNQIEQTIGNKFNGVPVRYVSDRGSLGTGGSFSLAASDCRNPELLVTNGDTLAHMDAEAMLDFHRRKRADATLALKPALAGLKTRHDKIVVDGEGRILDAEGLSGGGGAGMNCGVTLVNRDAVLSRFPAGVSRFEDILLAHGASTKCYGWLGVSSFLDIGVPSDYDAASEYVAETFGSA